jgi:hypothetical protein
VEGQLDGHGEALPALHLSLLVAVGAEGVIRVVLVVVKQALPLVALAVVAVPMLVLVSHLAPMVLALLVDQHLALYLVAPMAV